jgi:PAS domain S-box-containing protein
MKKKKSLWFLRLISRATRSRRVRWQLRVALVLFFIFPIAVITAWNYATLHYELTDAALSRRQTVVHAASLIIYEKLEHINDLGVSLSSRVVFQELIREKRWSEAVETIQTVFTRFPFIDRVFITDPEGIERAALPVEFSQTGQNLSQQDWFREVSQKKQPYLSNVYKSVGEAQSNVIAAAFPIKDGTSNKLFGILVLQVRLPLIFNWLKDIRVGGSGVIYVVDAQGQLVSHPRFSSQDSVIHTANAIGVQKALRGEHGVEQEYNINEKQNLVSAYEPVLHYGWAVIAEQPVDEVFKVRDQMLEFLLLIGTLLVFLTGGLAWFLVSTLEAIGLRHEQEKAYLALVESSNEAIFTQKISGEITSWNLAAERLYGYTAGEIMGQSCRHLMPPEAYEKFLEAVDRVKHNEQLTSFETVQLKKNGKSLEVMTTISPVYDEEKKVAGVSIFSQDITALKNVEKKLTEMAAHARSIIETTRDAFVSINAKGLVCDWNTAAQEMFGWTRHETLNQPLAELIIPPQYRAAHLLGMERFLKTGEAIIFRRSIEMHGLHKEGYEFPVELTVWPSGKKENLIVNAFIRNISERKRTEKLILEKEKLIAHSQSELEQLEIFAFVASHDLQEPLHKITAFGGLLKQHLSSKAAPEELEYLDRILAASKRMMEKISGLRDFSRVMTEGKPFERVDLNEVIEDILSDSKEMLGEIKAQLDIGKLPTLSADKEQIRSVLQNLIGNAIKFRKKTEPLKLSISSRPLELGMVEITVSDNGVGFDPQYVSQIFKPFKRLHGVSEYEGSGMGLAICQKVILRHGGKITAKSESGKGAQFVITLPLQPEATGV